jgi:hypothetical protein
MGLEIDEFTTDGSLLTETSPSTERIFRLYKTPELKLKPRLKLW